MEPVLMVSHLQKYYGSRGSVTRAIDDVSFTVHRGEFVGIMGASGSGKTTLLNCISTIDTATAGEIIIEGANVTRLKSKALARFRREKLGFIFQDCNLLDTLTAFENIALALSILRTPPGQVRRRVEETAELLGISDCLHKYPYQMSGGQHSCRPRHHHPARPGSGRRAHRRPGLQSRPAASGPLRGAQQNPRRHHFDGDTRRLYRQLLPPDSLPAGRAAVYRAGPGQSLPEGIFCPDY